MGRASEEQLVIENAVDFTRRGRHGTIRTIGLCYLAALIALVCVTGVIDQPSAFHYTALCIIFGILSAYAVYALQKNLDLITDIEFQNAIFSSAIAQQGMFTVVIRPNGSVAYADERFRQWFPAIKSESDNILNRIFEAMDLALSDKERILQSIQQQRSEHILITLVDDKGYSHLVRLSCRPLQRPHGLMLLQGREFITARNERDAAKDAGTAESHTKFISSVVEDVTVGLFACSPTGYIRIVNHTLETMLGYTPGEIIAKQMEYASLFYEVDKTARAHQELKDLSMPVLLAHKNGSIVKAMLSQKTLRDREDNVLATVALVETA